MLIKLCINYNTIALYINCQNKVVKLNNNVNILLMQTINNIY
jgi:hypothetical protein